MALAGGLESRVVIDDFAGLASRTSARDRWLALGGPSGSGKSTLTRWLLATHPGWAGDSRVFAHVGPEPLDLTEALALTEPGILLLDEIVRLDQLADTARLVLRGHRVLVCTHLPAPCFAPLGFAFRGRFVSTAVAGEDKITRELRRRGLRVSSAGVRAYLARFGPVYTEIDLVLERCPTDDFDHAMRWFAKFHTLRRERA